MYIMHLQVVQILFFVFCNFQYLGFKNLLWPVRLKGWTNYEKSLKTVELNVSVKNNILSSLANFSGQKLFDER